MKHRVPHDLSPELAKKAADKAWASYSERFAKYSPTANWTSDSHADVGFSVKGLDLSGTIDLVAGAIELDLDVPFLFRAFKKTALEKIDGEIQKWIVKAKNGELDD